MEVPQVGSTTQGTVREEHVQGETKREENPPQVVQQAEHRSIFHRFPHVTLGFLRFNLPIPSSLPLVGACWSGTSGGVCH